ncbi:MAG: hypothetical protein ACXVCH_03720 [Bdellovibrionota bacterium]
MAVTRTRPFLLIALMAAASLSAGARNARAYTPASTIFELPQLVPGPRTNAMGGAGVAITDDEEAIFLNPAGMAGIPRFAFHLVSLDATVSGDIFGMAAGAITGGFAIPNVSSLSSLNAFVGKNYYARETAHMDFTVPYFGFSVFGDVQTGFSMNNASFPVMTGLYEFTRGVQLAFGYPVINSKKLDLELRLGASGKFMFRNGGYSDISLLSLASFNLASFIPNTFPAAGMGFGGDAGAQLIKRFRGGWFISAGSALTDVAGTNFYDTAGRLTGTPSIPMNWTLGLGGGLKTKKLSAILAFDWSNTLDDIDWRKKSHLGLELGIPWIKVYGGLNGGYVSFGANLNVWIMNIKLAYYTEELGATMYTNPESRYLLRIDFGFGL